MAADTVVPARIDVETKDQVSAVLAEMELSISDYVPVRSTRGSNPR
jgi:antitoxin component of RelBE/YafQ-DinJ toxin-antitoxin module